MSLNLSAVPYDLVISLFKRSSLILMTKTASAFPQASVGVLMLDTRFPRILGDVGNPGTWPFPVEYKVVAGASPDAVIRKDPLELLDIFVEAGQELIENGVCGITTTCGFLSLMQKELKDALNVPVATSSLMQIELINRILPPNQRCGILTISGSSLTQEHLNAAQVPKGTPIGTTEGGREFSRAILNDEPDLNVDLARQDNVEAARELQRQSPELGAIVLECTNMTPYARDISRAINLPVFTIYSFVTWFHSGLVPRQFR